MGEEPEHEIKQPERQAGVLLKTTGRFQEGGMSTLTEKNQKRLRIITRLSKMKTMDIFTYN